MNESPGSARFAIGQVIRHRLFGYRGVIVDVDARFSASDDWYRQMARSRPPRDAPWYHVLVHDQDLQTYVAERNLAQDDSGQRIEHPRIGEYFGPFRDGHYSPRQAHN